MKRVMFRIIKVNSKFVPQVFKRSGWHAVSPSLIEWLERKNWIKYCMYDSTIEAHQTLVKAYKTCVVQEFKTTEDL